jgi:hypothetical protein
MLERRRCEGEIFTGKVGGGKRGMNLARKGEVRKEGRKGEGGKGSMNFTRKGGG